MGTVNLNRIHTSSERHHFEMPLCGRLPTTVWYFFRNLRRLNPVLLIPWLLHLEPVLWPAKTLGLVECSCTVAHRNVATLIMLLQKIVRSCDIFESAAIIAPFT